MEGILGMEQPVEFSMGSLLDPTMALLLIGAYKNYADFVYKDYKDYMDQQKEFNKEMGDFFSYFRGDNQAWYDATRGKIQKAYDYLLQNGIDPLRSMEGRAYLSNLMNSIKYEDLANLRANAETSKEYVKNRGKLIAEGLFNLDMEDFAARTEQGTTFDDYTTIGNDKMWTRTSPVSYKSLFDATLDHFKGMKDGYLYTQNGYDYSGITPQRIRDNATLLVNSGWGDTDFYGRYYKDLARKKLGPNATELQINAQLADDITAQHEKWLARQDREVNKYNMASYEANLRDQNDAKSQARSNYYSKRSGGRGGGGNDSQQQTVISDPFHMTQAFLLGKVCAKATGTSVKVDAKNVSKIIGYAPVSQGAILGKHGVNRKSSTAKSASAAVGEMCQSAGFQAYMKGSGLKYNNASNSYVIKDPVQIYSPLQIAYTMADGRKDFSQVGYKWVKAKTITKNGKKVTVPGHYESGGVENLSLGSTNNRVTNYTAAIQNEQQKGNTVVMTDAYGNNVCTYVNNNGDVVTTARGQLRVYDSEGHLLKDNPLNGKEVYFDSGAYHDNPTRWNATQGAFADEWGVSKSNVVRLAEQ